MKKADFKIPLLLSLLCFIAGFFVLPYQLETMRTFLPDQYDEVIRSIPFPMSVMLILSSLQIFLLSFILSFIGIKLARRTGLSLFNNGILSLNKRSSFLSVSVGIFVALIITGADKFYYQFQIPLIRENNPEFSLLGLVTGVLYGGIFEEILLRLFFMSLLIWIFMKVFMRDKENISSKYYWIAILISSLLFAVGHLPATEMIFGELTLTLVIRSFLLNGIGGLFFGYLYWKLGFEYAILAHMFTHLSLQLIFIPLFY